MSSGTSRARASTLAIALMAITSSLVSPSPVLAQSAAQEGSEAVPLPPVVVESSAAKPKKAAAKKKTPTVQPAASAAPVVGETAPDANGASAETGKGPVNGYSAKVSATGTKTDTPLLEIPQSISVITQDQISDQQARTVNEALRYTPGVSLDGFGSNVFFDSIKIRGFTAPQYLDGLRLPTDSAAFAVPRIETYGLERLEVLKGPSSGLYGQSDPGGLINMVSKRPLDTPHFEVVGTTGSFDRLEGAFDVGGPVSTNPNLLYRVVGLARESDTEVDYQENNKLFIAPSVTWRMDTATSLTVLSQYQKIDNAGYQQYVPGQVTLLSSPYGRIPRSRYLGEPGFDKYDLEQWSIGYEFEHRFQPGLEFRQNLRYFDITQDMQSMRGDFLVGTLFYRTPIYVDADASNFAVDNQLQADFTTGPLKHTLLAGLDYQRTRSSNTSLLANDMGDYRPIDVFNPVYGALPIPSRGDLAAFLDVESDLEQTGLYLQDQIKLDRWTLSLSGRQDWTTVETTSSGLFPPKGDYERKDSAQTGRVGLSYLFDFGLAPYISYSTSFVPNSGADSSKNTFEPTTGEGKEVGLKFMPNGTNLMFTAALFDILQQDILTPVGLYYVQTDEARVRGFEFEVRGNVTRELEIVGGYSKLDPEITKSSAGFTGNYVPNVNLDQASLWAKYTWFDGPLAGFGIGGGVRYVGENYGDQANNIYIPSYTVLDATASYDFAYLDPKLDGWHAQINATNLEDEYYVASCQSGLAYCGLGAGRTVLGTLKYSWK
ncbi:TonB-dependent siderophore receptor [Hyphomicrobium sp.]|uniref:TonB-dependent siderophore receptor n=1 Tax=Hyphomicrobium sp. TaxID=82 RepID=UPI002E35B277|nr:TonB-dependent siderophore receptor [Hyphomicrobium sp.]HEX2842720.1 TonB-dependent siderophore receptor [Hyphomicrobium sp.]